MVDRVLANTHEISLKGGNRPWFERTLTANVRRALADLPVAEILRPAWRVLIAFSEPVSFIEVARRLGTVFGLHAYMPVAHCGHTLAELEEKIAADLGAVAPGRFAVRCTRSDKRFPHSSPEIERRIGRFIQERTGWPVDLTAPEITFHLLVDEGGLWLWRRSVPGPGGLPLGVGGRALCMLSGGIDSPVAAYLVMKRGVRADLVHFHSVPRTDTASLDKVLDVARVLNRYQGRCTVALVPLLDIQEQVVGRCPESVRILLYRRFMLRIADRLARRLRASALVTGESLGQVASQTVENLGAVARVATLPVLRPLIALDKQEIIAAARRAGTYELSIQPHVDCCSFLMPSHPATRTTAERLAEAEAPLEVGDLVDAALAATRIERLDDAAPWEEIPVPVAAECRR